MKPEAPAEGHARHYTGKLKVVMTSPPVPDRSAQYAWSKYMAGIRWMQGEVTVLLTATVDLLALNPSITSYGIYPNEQTGKKSYSCAARTVRVTRKETVANGLKCHWLQNPLCRVCSCACWFPSTAAMLFCSQHFRSLELYAMKLCCWYVMNTLSTEGNEAWN